MSSLSRLVAAAGRFSEGERELGLNSIAAPVFGSDGEIIAAIAIGGPAFRMCGDAIPALGSACAECAAAVSRALHWRGGSETPKP